MKNFVAELLPKLAQKEEESQDLAAQVETLEWVIIEMLHNMVWNDRQISIRQIEGVLIGGNCVPVFLTNIYNAGECALKAL